MLFAARRTNSSEGDTIEKSVTIPFPLYTQFFIISGIFSRPESAKPVGRSRGSAGCGSHWTGILQYGNGLAKSSALDVVFSVRTCLHMGNDQGQYQYRAGGTKA